MRLLLTLLVLFASPALSGCGRQEPEILLEEEQKEEEEKGTDAPEPEITPEITNPPQDIFVDVCGAVAKPGVYRMPFDSRVFQAVEAAGGFLPEAAGSYVNQALPLNDGQQIYVPTKEEAEKKGEALADDVFAAAETGESSQPEENGKVNLNTADAAALQTLSGIGESKAQAILAYREEHGGFSSIEELMDVPGIKENTFIKIKDKIAVE
ncbi:helix-hairpin-helix domain-containing protein [Blautia sp.]|uniref:helix-hairpin-helix domain-containing protein n=1 Tax=Blautia sp. TaxID=1955243 RepID=UPI003D8B4118